jgi:hypothetical protein
MPTHHEFLSVAYAISMACRKEVTRLISITVLTIFRVSLRAGGRAAAARSRPAGAQASPGKRPGRDRCALRGRGPMPTMSGGRRVRFSACTALAQPWRSVIPEPGCHDRLAGGHRRAGAQRGTGPGAERPASGRVRPRPPPPGRRRELTRHLREHLIERLNPRGVPGISPQPHLIHETQHDPSLASQDPEITQPRRSRSQTAAVVVGGVSLIETVMHPPDQRSKRRIVRCDEYPRASHRSPPPAGTTDSPSPMSLHTDQDVHDRHEGIRAGWLRIPSCIRGRKTHALAADVAMRSLTDGPREPEIRPGQGLAGPACHVNRRRLRRPVTGPASQDSSARPGPGQAEHCGRPMPQVAKPRHLMRVCKRTRAADLLGCRLG